MKPHRSPLVYRQILKNINDPDVALFQADMLAHDHVDVRGTHPIFVTGQTGRQLTGAPRSISVTDARAWMPPPVPVEEPLARIETVRPLLYLR